MTSQVARTDTGRHVDGMVIRRIVSKQYSIVRVGLYDVGLLVRVGLSKPVLLPAVLLAL